MGLLDAKIKYFDIKKAGYYLRGANEPALSGVSDLLRKLKTWASDGRQFSNTTCYQADSSNDLYNTYFCDFAEDSASGDSVLILWNEIANDNGTIYGMDPSTKPGQSAMLSTGFGSKPAIPGMPSYFWFVPSQGIFASIKFDHSSHGKQNLENYLAGFLLNKAPYRVVDNDQKVVGFSKDGKSNEQSSQLSARFQAYARVQDQLEAELLANVDNISRIIKRETLQYSVKDDRNTIERVFASLLSNVPSFSQPRTIVHELQFSPTSEEIKQIIKNFSVLGAGSSIKNAGFQYKNGKRVMLTGTGIDFPYEFNIKRKDNQMVPASRLLSAIQAQRVKFLKMLDAPVFEVEQMGEET